MIKTDPTMLVYDATPGPWTTADRYDLRHNPCGMDYDAEARNMVNGNRFNRGGPPPGSRPGAGGRDASASIPGASASSSDDETDLCGKVGLGVDYFVTDQVSIGLEGAYFAGVNDLDNIRFYTVTAGVAYHF